MGSWIAAYCEPNREFLARDRLRSLGVEVFCPYETVKVSKRAPNRPGQHITSEKDVAIFAPYLFINTDRYLDVKNTLGVIKVVSIQGKPIIINDLIIDTLKGLGDVNGLIQRVAKPLCNVGDDVSFNDDSPLNGLIGKIASVAYNLADNISVSINIFGAEREVVVQLNTVTQHKS